MKGAANGSVRLELARRVEIRRRHRRRSRPRRMARIASLAFTVTPANLGEKPYRLRRSRSSEAGNTAKVTPITGYPGLRPYFLYTPSTYKTSGGGREGRAGT